MKETKKNLENVDKSMQTLDIGKKCVNSGTETNFTQQLPKQRKYRLKRNRRPYGYKVINDTPITEKDLDDIIEWYEKMQYALRALSYR